MLRQLLMRRKWNMRCHITKSHELLEVSGLRRGTEVLIAAQELCTRSMERSTRQNNPRRRVCTVQWIPQDYPAPNSRMQEAGRNNIPWPAHWSQQDWIHEHLCWVFADNSQVQIGYSTESILWDFGFQIQLNTVIKDKEQQWSMLKNLENNQELKEEPERMWPGSSAKRKSSLLFHSSGDLMEF